MFRLSRAQVQPIGVDLGGDSIKMLQLEIVGESLSVVAAARQAMPFDVREASLEDRLAVAAGIVRNMLRQNPFNGRNVVLALPREMVHIKNFRLPPTAAVDLPAAVMSEARTAFDFDIDGAQVRHLPAGDVRQGSESRHETIVFAARNEEVDRFVEQFHGSGAVIQSLDVEPCAVYRSIERFIRRREDEHDVHVMVDIGWNRSLVVIGRGRDIALVKPIDIGGKQLNAMVARNLGLNQDEAVNLRRRLSEAAVVENAPRDPVRQAVYDATRSIVEELGREIALCLRYYSVTFRGSRPTRMRLVGGEACDPNVLLMLNAALPMPVDAGRPLYSINTSKMKPADRRGTLSEWTVALGLALKATTMHFGARDGKPRDPNAPRAGILDVPATIAPPAPPPPPEAPVVVAVPEMSIPDVGATLVTTPVEVRPEVTHA